MKKILNKKVHKFIDEAGDPNFYGKGGTVIVGQEGVSLCFCLGMVDFKNTNLDEVRILIEKKAQEISNFQYYQNIPSVKKRIAKYGKFIFHAKHDLPEIRKEFFDLIKGIKFSTQVMVGRKIPDLFIKKHNKSENEFYADLLGHLIKDKLKQKLVLNIASRGKTTNDINLNLAIKKAKDRKSNTEDCQIVFNVQPYDEEPLLSIVDYVLWAIQRVFEKGEIRFYEYIFEKFVTIIDLYDLENFNQTNSSGKKQWKNYYNKLNKLTIDNKIDPSSS